MTETTDNSSLPMLLGITAAVVVVAVGGWFYLEQADAPAVEAPSQPDTFESLAEAAAPEAEEVVPDPEETVATPESEIEDTADVDAELRKARLAAGADILVFPDGQSALYYYAQVLEMQPGHELASAELDSMLGTVARSVSEQLARGEFDNAYAVAVQVAQIRPDHALVTEVQQTLDGITEEQVDIAIRSAQEGDDAEAERLVAEVEGLPGRNPQYIAAVRESIEEIRQVRVAAEEDRTARALLAATEAKDAWVTSVSGAIQAGNLISPAGASARDLLAEENEWDAERQQLYAELLTAIESSSYASIQSGNLADAERLLLGAIELSGDAVAYQPLRDELEQAFCDAEAAEIKVVSDLEAISLSAARYPRRAMEKNISGWVDVLFTVSPDGTPVDIEVADSQPEETFDNAAIAAVEKWRFEPVEYRGQVIAQRAGARLKFELE